MARAETDARSNPSRGRAAHCAALTSGREAKTASGRRGLGRRGAMSRPLSGLEGRAASVPPPWTRASAWAGGWFPQTRGERGRQVHPGRWDVSPARLKLLEGTSESGWGSGGSRSRVATLRPRTGRAARAQGGGSEQPVPARLSPYATNRPPPAPNPGWTVRCTSLVGRISGRNPGDESRRWGVADNGSRLSLHAEGGGMLTGFQGQRFLNPEEARARQRPRRGGYPRPTP